MIEVLIHFLNNRALEKQKDFTVNNMSPSASSSFNLKDKQ